MTRSTSGLAFSREDAMPHAGESPATLAVDGGSMIPLPIQFSLLAILGILAGAM
jgi:hypothetical protein